MKLGTFRSLSHGDVLINILQIAGVLQDENGKVRVLLAGGHEMYLGLNLLQFQAEVERLLAE